MNKLKTTKVSIIMLSILVIIAIFVIAPWFTFEAFQRVTDGQEFGFGGWLAAIWLMILMGGAAASNR